MKDRNERGYWNWKLEQEGRQGMERREWNGKLEPELGRVLERGLGAETGSRRESNHQVKKRRAVSLGVDSFRWYLPF